MRKFIGSLLFGALAIVQSMAHADPVLEKPTFFYIVGNDYSKIYSSFQAAYAADQARLAAAPDPYTGLVHWRAVGVQSWGLTMNDTPLLEPSLEYFEYNSTTKQGTWVPRPRAGQGRVNTIPECAKGRRLELRPGSGMPN